MNIKDKSNLFQYDINQSLVNVNGKYVDFPIGKEIYRVAVTDGECRIPDEFLQNYGTKTVYVTYADGTYEAVTLNIKSRPIPPDYEFTPTERETFDSLVAKVNNAVADLYAKADSGEFNGKDGEDGVDGINGTNGRDGVDGRDGKDGINGVDGYSPSAKVERTTNGAKITITDKNGTTETEVFDGKGSGDSIDVQINGTSIVEDGVANIPLAENNGSAGLVKIGSSNYGMQINANGYLSQEAAGNSSIDNRSSRFNPIVPAKLDYAVKRAMCDGKGTEWTDDEKASARVRLGISDYATKAYVDEAINGLNSIIGSGVI